MSDELNSEPSAINQEQPPVLNANELAAKQIAVEGKEQLEELLKSTPDLLTQFIKLVVGDCGLIAGPDAVPEWTRKCASRIRRAFLPTIKKSETLDSPLANGKLIGHIHGVASHYDVLCAKGDPIPDKVQLLQKTLIQSLKSMVGLVLSETVKMPFEEQKEFFRGFSIAMDGTPDDVAEFLNSSSSLLVEIVIVARWREVEMMNSTDELHDWLDQELSQSLAGSLARTQKLCQRIGLKLAPKGRPRKNNKTTTKSRSPI